MSLPIKTTIEDVDVICKYLSSKATGATMKEAKAVLDPKYLDGRKLSALETWGFIEQSVDRLKLTSRGRDFNSGDANRRQAILRAINSRAIWWLSLPRMLATQSEMTTGWYPRLAVEKVVA